MPPQFASFAKSGLFQVYDKDSLDHQVKLVSRSSSREGVAIEPAFVFAPKQQPRGVLKASFTNRSKYLTGVVVDATLQTDASKASSLAVKAKNVVPSVLPGLNVTLTETTSEKDFSASKPKYGAFLTAAADYAHRNGTATASVTTDGDSALGLAASASVGFEGVTVGGDVKLTKSGSGSLAPKSYNAGIQYQYKQYTGALVSDSLFEKLKFTLLTDRVIGNAQVGVQAKVDLQAPKVGAPQREVIVSGSWASGPSTACRIAVVATQPSGLLAVEHRLRNPDALVAVTAVIAQPPSFYSPWPITKFGVNVTLGDY